MVAAGRTVAEMLAVGCGLPEDSFSKLLDYGPHLLASTGSDIGTYNKVGTVLAGFHYDLNFLTRMFTLSSVFPLPLFFTVSGVRAGLDVVFFFFSFLFRFAAPTQCTARAASLVCTCGPDLGNGCLSVFRRAACCVRLPSSWSG